MRGPTSADILLFWPPACPWMNWSCAVICYLSISWWDHNVSITFVVLVACLSVMGYFLPTVSHRQGERAQCAPRNGTRCSSLCVTTPVLETVWLWVRDAKDCERVCRAVKGNKCPTLWRRETDRDTNVNRACEPEFDPGTELGTHRRDRLQTDCKVIRYNGHDRGRVSTERILSVLSIHLV